MGARIAIIDSSLYFSEGLAGALRDLGFDVRASGPAGTAASHALLGHCDALLTEADNAEQRSRLRRFRERQPQMALVALSARIDAEDCADALRAGADSAVPRDATPDQVAAVIRHALSGHSLLPTVLVREIAQSSPVRSRPALSEKELKWLRAVARGVTVRRVAHEAGYSERQMFRILDRLYERLGAANRNEAIVNLTIVGLLTPPYEDASDC